MAVVMLPLIPKSVKMEKDVSVRLRAMADLIGYSENQFVVESVKAMLDGVDDENNSVPLLIAMIRTARDHEKAPPEYGKREKTRDKAKSHNWWWGTK